MSVDASGIDRVIGQRPLVRRQGGMGVAVPVELVAQSDFLARRDLSGPGVR